MADRRILEAIAGQWRTEGTVLDTPRAGVTGTDVYELLPGGFFLVHYVDVTVGGRPVRAIEIIGEPASDPAADLGTMLARSYDNQGEMTIMRVRVDEAGAWHFSGGPEVAPKARQDAVAPSSGAVRSTLRVGAERQTMSAFWERSDDGIAWLPWMEVGFTRMTD